MPGQATNHSGMTAIARAFAHDECLKMVAWRQALPPRCCYAYQGMTLRSVAVWCIATVWMDSARTCTIWVSAISQVARLRIGVYLDYSRLHEPGSMPPSYAAPGMQQRAPDHNGGSASDVFARPPSCYRA
jgi:hypothetical protein